MIKVNSRMTIRIKEFYHYFQRVFFGKSLSYIIKIIAAYIFTIGVFMFLFTLGLNNKTGLTLILTGLIIFFCITDKNINIIFDSIIILILILWVWIIFFITGGGSLGIFFFLIVIGMLIIKEFTDIFLTSNLKKRILFLISIFCFVYVIFIVEKIISYLNI